MADIAATMTTGDRDAITTVLHDRGEMAALMPAWQDLAARCAEDNVYYAPRYASALLDTVEARSKPRLVTAWRKGKLIGLLPVTTSALVLPGIRPGGQAWRTLYTFSCTPLLDKDTVGGAAAAVLDGLAALRRGEWALPTLNTDGPACGVMIDALRRRDVPFALVNPFERACLPAGPSFDEHMKSHVAPKLRRELARNRRRLEERGSVTFETHRAGPGLAKAVDDFLRIEASGWKGRRGTAMACSAASRALALRAFNSPTEGACRADVLALNGTPIAVGLIVFAGGTGFTVKNAYDEAYGSVAAGLLLELEIIQSFLSERWAERLDSGTNGKHVIDRLWSGRIKVADLVFSLAPVAARARLATYCAAARAAARLKARAKTVLKRD